VTESQLLTTLEVLAQADSTLTGGGYRPVAHGRWDTSSGSARAYEDAYGVVAVFIFDTPTDLENEWPNAQADLVALLTEFMSRDEAKAWEGYAVLLSPATGDVAQQERLNEIRRDTSRVRKIVATGSDLGSVSDVDRVLLPLLPFDLGRASKIEGSALDVLPGLLAEQGIPPELSQSLVSAFNQQTSLIRALHKEEGGE